jgi:hypothetical protein
MRKYNLFAVGDRFADRRPLSFERYGPSIIDKCFSQPYPNPTSVTIADRAASEAGCPGDWDPACATTYLTRRER